MAVPVTTRSPRYTLTGSFTAALAVACLVLAAAPASAAGHKARLSADLADHLSAGSQSIRVIVHGTRAEVDALAVRYNLTVARYMKSGAVLLVNAGSWRRFSRTTPRITCRVTSASSRRWTRRTWSVGADQVWTARTTCGRRPARASIAVIDSRIDSTTTRSRAGCWHARLHRRRRQDPTGTGRTWRRSSPAAPAGRRRPRTTAASRRAPTSPNLRVLGTMGRGRRATSSRRSTGRSSTGVIQRRIINLSLGAPVLQPYRDDPLCEAVERAVGAGLVVVVAAGNYGKTADGSGDGRIRRRPTARMRLRWGRSTRTTRPRGRTTRWRATARGGRRATTWG